jgi:hypothetical protein
VKRNTARHQSTLTDTKRPEAIQDSLRVVRVAEDKKPKVTMFLLKYLERETIDTNLKAQISGAIKYIKEQTSKG